MRARTWAILGVGAAAAVAVGVVATRPSSAGTRDLIVTSTVTRRDIQNKVTLTGTIGRLAQRTVTAGDAAQISDVQVKDGAVVHAGSPIIGINGREAVAEMGTFPFFRPLDVGDTGQDVEQLDQILAHDGYDPGPIGTMYTTQTQFALAQWQAAHGYPGAAPDRPETVTVSLQPSDAYKVGAQNTAGVVIGPTSGGAGILDSRRSGAPPEPSAGPSAVLASYRRPGPVLTDGVFASTPTTTTTTTTGAPTTTTTTGPTTTTSGAPPTTPPMEPTAPRRRRRRPRRR